MLVEEAPLQVEVAAVETWLWREIALTRNPAHGFVPRPCTTIATRVCLFTEDREKPLKMASRWVGFITTHVIMQSTEEVRCPTLTKASWYSLSIIASVAVERDNQDDLCQLLLIPKVF